MELEEILKNLKNINPRSEFTRQSRNLILNSRLQASEAGFWAQSISLNKVLARLFNSGAAIVLTGILVMAALAAFSFIGRFSPGQMADLKLDRLSAEAQEIDIQIELAKLNYTENSDQDSSAAINSDQSQKPAEIIKNKILSDPVFRSAAEDFGFSLNFESASTSPDIEGTLEILGQ